MRHLRRYRLGAALSDRDDIFTDIEAHTPMDAIAIDDRILAATHRLRDFPESGRPGRVAGTRELVIAGTPYVAAYQIVGATIRILRVLHGAQRWQNEFPHA
ncbi:type II toxin-antitoxin system RelE/ParE family toxin [Rhodopseudomonas parapalustris]